MNPILKVVASIIVAMLTEIFVRRIGDQSQADQAEATAIAVIVAIGMQAANEVKLPVYLLPIKAVVVNPVALGQLAKFLLDLSEEHLNKLLDAVKSK